MKRWGSKLLVWTALGALWVPPVVTTERPAAAQGASALRIQPAKPRQGDFLILSLEERSAERVSALWLGRTIRFRKQGERWMGIAPVPVATQPGGHRLTLHLAEGGQVRDSTHSVTVAKVRFGTQRLSMNPGTARLYNYPGVEKEDRLVSGAIGTFSDELRMAGDWMLPVQGRMSTPFGVKRIRNGRQVGYHRGLDFAVPKGTPIKAPAAGRVVLAGMYRKHGGTVVLDHGLGVTSLYLHQSAILVKKGQVVEKGDVVGKVGSTGVSTGPHLHWAAYSHGTPLEPLFMVRMSKRGVRLEP